MLAERFSVLLFLAAGAGLIANWTGLYASYKFDLPTGPSIMAALGGWLVVASLLKGFILTVFRRF